MIDMKFVFADSVYALGVRGIYFNLRGIANLPSSDPRVRQFVEQQLSLVPADLERSDVIVGFSDLHSAVSKRPDKLISSPVGLLSFFRAHRDIPRINGIVDVYNAISVASGIAIGAHDLAQVDGDIELRFTKGDEYFVPLGAGKVVRVPAGEYAYVDSKNEVLCRLEVRQVEKTKITLDSQDVFFIVQGHQRVDPSKIEGTAKALVASCQEIFGGDLQPLYPHAQHV